MRLKDKAALITGGGRGIGATTALMMLGEGAKVGIVDVNEDAMKKTRETARSKGYDLKTLVGDVTEKDQVERFIGGLCKGVRTDRYPGQQCRNCHIQALFGEDRRGLDKDLEGQSHWPLPLLPGGSKIYGGPKIGEDHQHLFDPRHRSLRPGGDHGLQRFEGSGHQSDQDDGQGIGSLYQCEHGCPGPYPDGDDPAPAGRGQEET